MSFLSRIYQNFIYSFLISIDGVIMIECHDMEKGQIYMCEDCGFEMKVVNECGECCETEEEGTCATCEFMCCGEELTLKN